MNQHGTYFGIREGAGSMLKNTAKESKSIINLSSTAGFIGGTPFACGYFAPSSGTLLTYSHDTTDTASKWAVRGMTKHASLTLAPHGIRVNSVHRTFPLCSPPTRFNIHPFPH